MDNPLIALLVIFAIAVLLGRAYNTISGRGRTPKGFPYQTQSNFLSPAELNFFRVLQSVVRDRAIICLKVGLGDIFSITSEGRSNYRGYRNRITQKHVDFLLCDPVSLRPLVAIELDDKSHEREDRKARDAFVDQVFQAAHLPLLHAPVKRSYVTSELDALLSPILDVTPKEKPVPIDLQPDESSDKKYEDGPRCPKCGSPMRIREAKKGLNQGQKFWGCSNYPDCRGVVRYQP